MDVKGKKTGGRQPGTPNRRTQEAAEKLAALGLCPLEGMAALALDQANSPELRGRMLSELAQYVFPKRKASEVSGPDGGPVVVEAAELDVARLSRDERAALRTILTRAVAQQG